MAGEVKERTPTETLMEALSSFGEDEPVNCMVIYTTQRGDICWHSSNSSFTTKLGLVEAVKFYVQEAMRKALDDS
jgi:hypothetical protein